MEKWIQLWCTVFCIVSQTCIHYKYSTGMQEYSQRQAGVTWAIVLCVLVPIVLVVVFVAFWYFRRERDPEVSFRETGDTPVITKHTKLGSFQEPTESDKLNEKPIDHPDEVQMK